ncbi:MAG: proteasome accessory factor PafA2 family protein [Planctomycetota bacterium]
MKILDRLVGLETEYAIRFQPREDGADSPSRFQLYQALIARIHRHVPTVPAKHFKEGVFLANGGAVWFETERPAAGGGLIEGATPECRGPSELLRYQRAQDQLLGQSAGLANVDGKFSLVKNDRDAAGHVYGAQENYEALLYDGWSFWHVGLVLLLPLLFLTWLGMALMMGGVLFYLILAGLFYLFCHGAVPNRRQLAFALFGRDLVQGKAVGGPTPVWLEGVLLWLTRAVSLPLALGLLALVWLTAFRRARRQLTPFLVSRCVFAGAGMVDRHAGFLLADKAPGINTVLGLGGFFNDRPIFTMGHLFKALCAESLMSPRAFFRLFRRHQRLQIGLGDSNMAELSEFLRVGTTGLVLDVIEAGAMPPLPALCHPIQALHQICGDPSLRQGVSFVDGRQMTALGIQRFYLNACRAYVEQAADAPAEAFQVLDHWKETLDELEVLQATGEIPDRLIGGIDWITKKKLLEETGSDMSWSACKKLDIAYHELTPFGYFQMLQAAGLAVSLVDPKTTDRAVRTPPPDTPATMRGHYIREFSADAAPVTANWSKVVIPGRSKSKTVYLDRYARRPQSDGLRPRQETSRD